MRIGGHPWASFLSRLLPLLALQPRLPPYVARMQTNGEKAIEEDSKIFFFILSLLCPHFALQVEAGKGGLVLAVLNILLALHEICLTDFHSSLS